MNRHVKPFCIAVTLLLAAPSLLADNLLDVFNQALKSDPTFQAAGANRSASNEGIPIAFSFLMPQFVTSANVQHNIQINRVGSGLPSTFNANGLQVNTGPLGRPGTFNFPSGGYNLNLSQTLFDYSAWASWKEARASSRASDATYTAALQDLMSRTAQAYFNVLQAQDDLRYIQAEKKAIYQQLDQVSQEYKVGLVAITSVYQAQAGYDSIISQEIAAQNNVINQRENLRAITGIYYNDLDGLRANIPLLMPNPSDPQVWVKTAGERNWSVIASRYTAQAAREQIQVQQGGHLPTVDAFAQQQLTKAGQSSTNRINNTQNAIGIELSLPVFQGGLVNAQTKQASYNYQGSLDQIEQTYRNAYNATEQSYNNVVAFLSQVKADSQAIVSNASSMRSTIESFRVGTETMLDVLNAQQNLYDAERQFSRDQYGYINATIALKAAAGILDYNDLVQINKILVATKANYSSLNIQSIQAQAQADYQQNIEQSNALISNSGGITPASPYAVPTKPAPYVLPPVNGTSSGLKPTQVSPPATVTKPVPIPATPTNAPSSNAATKPANAAASVPASGATTKPANVATGAPASSATTKPASAATSAPASSVTTKPANAATIAPSSSATTKPASSPTSATQSTSSGH